MAKATTQYETHTHTPLVAVVIVVFLATFIESSPVSALSSEYSWFRYI
jgi:hypothetical protein